MKYDSVNIFPVIYYSLIRGALCVMTLVLVNIRRLYTMCISSYLSLHNYSHISTVFFTVSIYGLFSYLASLF